jgi:aminobenzoyl-glutamate utilization protein B
MAGLAVEALTDPTLIGRAQADHRARTAAEPYECPLPPDATPPLQARGAS